jgi:hypothetical protein
VLGLTLDLGIPSFYENVQSARDAGRIGTADVSFAWSTIERPFDAGDGDAASTVLFEPALHAVRLALESERLSIVLGLDALDATGPRLPPDLRGLALDDPAVLARSDALVDYAVAQMDALPLAALLVGSDVDVALGADASRWSAFATLAKRMAARAKAKRAGLAVGFSVTAKGLLDHAARVATAAAPLDVVGVSYLPVDEAAQARRVDAVRADLAAIVAAAPAGKPILLRAVGYPSAPAAGSDEATQARFVAALFGAWDVERGRMPIVVLAPLDDATDDAARDAAARRGRSDEAYAAMLASLGLRTATGREKAALRTLATSVRARGF